MLCIIVHIRYIFDKLLRSYQLFILVDFNGQREKMKSGLSKGFFIVFIEGIIDKMS